MLFRSTRIRAKAWTADTLHFADDGFFRRRVVFDSDFDKALFVETFFVEGVFEDVTLFVQDFSHAPLDFGRRNFDDFVPSHLSVADSGEEIRNRIGNVHFSLLIEASISRAMHQICTREQLDLAMRFKQVYSTYQQNRDLVTVGAYRRGADPRVDMAVEQWPKMMEFLRQDMYEPIGIDKSNADLKQLVTQFSAQAAPNS